MSPISSIAASSRPGTIARTRAWSATLITLNALDAVLSLRTTNGGLDEYSPLWEWLMSYSMAMFVVAKIAVISSLVLFLATRGGRIGRVGIYVCTAIYAALFVYQVYVLTGGAPVDLWEYRIGLFYRSP